MTREDMYRNDNEIRLNEKYDLFSNIGEISGRYLKTIFPKIDEAKREIVKNNIKTYKEWKEFARSSNGGYPICPNKVYKNEWNGWKDFLTEKAYVETKRI